MFLALRAAIEAAEGANMDLDALARQLDADRAVVRAALQHGVAQGWFPGVEFAVLPEGCGSTGCAPEPSSVTCRRCPLAR